MTAAKVTILGCGGSGGVPLAGAFWGKCDPNNPKNRRRRASIAVQTETTTLVVDSGPDFREQTITAGLTNVDAVLYSHAHADHINGMDDLRYLTIIHKRKMPIYADEAALNDMQQRFTHLFVDSADGFYPACVVPQPFRLHTPMRHGDISFTAFKQLHGSSGHSIGYRFGNFAYSTDCAGLPPESIDILRGVDTWIVDCGQFGSQEFLALHPNLEIVQGWNEQVRAKHVILTHLTPRIDFQSTQDSVPEGFEVASDSLSLDVAI